MTSNQQRDSRYTKELFFYNATKRQAYSVDPIDSDVYSNLVIMDQVVGTLVKYGHSGRYEPYLAKTWTVSKDQLTWDFILRDGLVDQNNNKITAKSFRDSLVYTLAYLYKESSSSGLDLLVDIEKIKTRTLDQMGIIAVDDDTLRFKFRKRPQGVIEYLAQPYYGHFSLENFDKNGSWKNKGNIISSGHYFLNEWDKNGKITLKKRPDWFSNDQKSPDIVYIKTVQSINEIDLSKKYVMVAGVDDQLDRIDKFTTIIGTPEILFHAVLSPFSSPFFSNSFNRRLFRKRLHTFKNKTNFNTNDSVFTDSFFKIQNTIGHGDGSYTSWGDEKFDRSVTEIKIAMAPKHKDILTPIVSKIFEDTNIKLKYSYIDFDSVEGRKKILSNKDFDIRFTWVNTGTAYANWVVQMMFCGKLGISFPDLENSVCQLTDKVASGEITENDASNLFEKLIDDQSIVIPIYRQGTVLHLSKGIVANDQSPTIMTVRFDITHLLE